jgi:enterochelin esterase-like enzyme
MKIIIVLFLSFLILMISCKKKVEKKKDVPTTITEKVSTKSENVSILKKEFVIEGLNDISHKIWLYLPLNYESSAERYPVIYMHDGQNLFDDATSFVGEWDVDGTLNTLYEKTGKSFIVVGVENGGEKRIEEYTPYKNVNYGGGKGDLYIDFLANDLNPLSCSFFSIISMRFIIPS